MARFKNRNDDGGSVWRASMSVALGLGLGFFVLTAVAGVLGIGLIVGYQNTVDLLRQKAALIISSQRKQTERFMQVAEDQVDFIVGQIANKEVEPGRSVEFVSVLLGAVSATPQILRLQFVDPDGNLTGVERQFDETSPIFQKVGDDSDLESLIDTTTSNLQPYWGKLLWRSEYNQAVLNYQRPVIEGDKLIGVISAWISVNKISEFLSDLELDVGASAFILHGREHVLAHPLMAFGYSGLNRASPLPVQSRFGDPVVSAMWRDREPSSIVNWFLSGPGVRHVGYGDVDYVILFDEIAGYSDRPWFIATYFESHDMTAEVKRLRWAIIFCILVSIISASTAMYIGRQIARPVRRLAEGAKKVHSLHLSEVERIPGNFFSELDDAARSFNVMLDGLRWFERYVPKGLVRRLMKVNPDREIQSSYREVAIMFTDIAGFTALSESLTAPAVASFLNDHFAMITKCVDAEGGTVDKFIGDSAMAIWGAPESQIDLADRACRCALSISRAIRAQNADPNPGAPSVQFRIGLHVGRVVVGNIGTAAHVDYTVVGDAVNVAHRLAEAGKTLGDAEQDVNILISGAVQRAMVQGFDLDQVGLHSLRGREEQVEVYVLRGESASEQ